MALGFSIIFASCAIGMIFVIDMGASKIANEIRELTEEVKRRKP